MSSVRQSSKIVAVLLVLLLVLTGCHKPDSKQPEEPGQNNDTENNNTNMEKTLKLYINNKEVKVNWENNESVKALMELVNNKDLTINMSMYGGFEQVGSLGTTLVRNDTQITTQAGDIVLYSGNQIVVFYGSNFWAYTRLGKITDKNAQQLKELLGNGDVTITITAE